MRSQIIQLKFFILHKNRKKMEISRRCDICNIDVHRAKHLRSTREEKNSKIKPSNFFDETNKPKTKKFMYKTNSKRKY